MSGGTKSVGTTYRPLDPQFFELVLPRVDVVEVTPEVLAQWGEGRPSIPSAILEELAAIARRARVVVHGVGLSIGSHDGWDDTALMLFDQLLAWVPVAWYSEHLGFVNANGRFLGTMLSLPRTTEARDLVADRITRLQQRYGLPVLLENVANLLPDPPSEMTEAGFLNAITEDTGCGILLDLHNLDCDAHNGRVDAISFLQELHLKYVAEIHVAGGTEHRGFMLDIHSRVVPKSTFELLQHVRDRLPRLEAAVYELMPEAVPAVGHQLWAEEIERLRQALMEDADCAWPTTSRG